MNLTEEQKKTLFEFAKSHINELNLYAQCFFKEDYKKVNFDYKDFLVEFCTYLFPEFQYELYKHFIDYLFLLFPDLNEKSILEIGSGYIPGFSLELLKFKDFKKPITCIDPNSLKIDTPGIINKKESLTKEYDVSNYNFLVAFCPCEGLESLVEVAIKEKIEFCVQSCTCDGRMPLIDYTDFLYRIDSILYRLEELKNYDFEILCTNIQTFDTLHAPVISARKRERN